MFTASVEGLGRENLIGALPEHLTLLKLVLWRKPWYKGPDE